MLTKGRLKSKNIEDRRTPKKIKNNNTKVVVWNSDNTFGGQTEKGQAKVKAFMDVRPPNKPFRTRKRKKLKNINAKVKK